MIITRAQLLLQGFTALFATPDVMPPLQQPQAAAVEQQQQQELCSPPNNKLCQRHEAPSGVNYEDNPTIFGEILRGELPAHVLSETTDLLCFADKTPRAPLHALVIPKQLIPTVFSLTKANLPLLEEMHTLALKMIQREQPEAYKKGDYVLCYHIAPFNSVNHLHLHALAPASQMSLYFRYVKYQAGTRWCTDEQVVRQRLQANKSAVPYYRYTPS